MALELGAVGPPDADSVELRLELIEQSALAESGFALDLDECQRTAQPCLNRIAERAQLGGPSQQATRQLGRAFPAAAESAREVRENILLSEDYTFDRACLGRRLEAELLVEQRAKGTVA